MYRPTRDQDRARQERHAPAPLHERFLRDEPGDDREDRVREQQADRRRDLDEPDSEA